MVKPLKTALQACNPNIATLAIADSLLIALSASTAPLIPPPPLRAPPTIITVRPRLPSPPIAPPTTPVILETLVIKPPTAVIAGPMTGDKPMKPRVNFAIALSEVAAHLRVSLVISSIAPLTPPFAAIALLVRSSQLPPTCSILEPMFCCISLACCFKKAVAVAVELAALSCSAA